ncbi:MAG: molybdenum cofactor biosynthesis protein [Thermoplasmata archaeon]|nr:molybdenum cofactor biosynthesis protein MoaB [Euryarchaeota archaeon]RLF63108.1 MAG: molybdenum cofactor biosynthesis protein [Thermoplasmata archaeon]
MDHHEHEEAAKEKFKSVRVSVITISDTRTETEDVSGRIIIELLQKSGHKIFKYTICKDDVYEIRRAVLDALRGSDVIITNGGTGVSLRDVTIEAIRPLFDKEIEGFGEIFRYLSYKEIGPSAILSRAMAGVIGDKVIFCLPGSKNAVRLAVEKLIIPIIPHVLYEVRKHETI